jgi:hypothetical protein
MKVTHSASHSCIGHVPVSIHQLIRMLVVHNSSPLSSMTSTVLKESCQVLYLPYLFWIISIYLRKQSYMGFSLQGCLKNWAERTKMYASLLYLSVLRCTQYYVRRWKLDSCVYIDYIQTYYNDL